MRILTFIFITMIVSFQAIATRFPAKLAAAKEVFQNKLNNFVRSV
jgi:hypothetical protein